MFSRLQQSLYRATCYNLIVVGMAEVGKSSLINAFVDGKFESPQKPDSTVMKEVTISNRKYVLSITEVSHEALDLPYNRRTIMSADGIMVLYANDDVASLIVAETLINDLKRRFDADEKSVVLIKTKRDLPEAARGDLSGPILAEKYGYVFNETSAMTMSNVNTVFIQMILLIKKKIRAKMEQDKSFRAQPPRSDCQLN